MWLLLIGLVVLVSFGLGAILGAPYLPTLAKQAEVALDLADLQPGQHLLDLGAGSGDVMVAAAKRGIKVTGIEINPLLWLQAWLRLWPYRQLASIKLGNYWQMDWPEVDAIYVFLITHQMPRLYRELQQRLRTPTKVVSYTFQIPHLKPRRTQGGVYLYELSGQSKKA